MAGFPMYTRLVTFCLLFHSAISFISPRIEVTRVKCSLFEQLQRDGSFDRFLNEPFSRSAFLTTLIAAPTAAYASTHISKDSKAYEESISGFIAGGALTVTKTIVKYPLDTATVRLQMPNSAYSIFDLPALFEGSYRGVLTPLLANIPAGAVFFAVKDATKAAIDPTLPSWVRTFIAVAFAQIPYWIVRNPSEVVKTRQQAGVDGYGDGVSALDAYKRVREDAAARNNSTGLEEFYTGYWENILYAYPADVIKFVCYDILSQGRKNLSPAEGAVAGAASTAIAQFLTTPLDVVRNRIMTGKNREQQESYLQSLVTLAQTEGIRGLFAGSTPRIGKAMLSGAIQFATYEETKRDIAKLFQRQ